jgi:hypothetical protein
MLTPFRIAVALCLSLLFAGNSLHASWREALPGAQLMGAGEFRVFGFAIYDAQLWSQAQVPADAVALRAPFALQLSYRRTISRDDLVEASLKEIRRLAAQQPNPAQLRRWEAEMQQAFVDVRAGDQITGVFLPGEGARFYVGTRLQHVVADEAFARAFFSIWLDARTRNSGLRAQLLGGTAP